MPLHVHTESVALQTQADGAFEIDLTHFENLYRHQMQVEVSATPSAGTLTVKVKTPGATTFQDIDAGVIDLTATLQPLELEARVSALEFTPAGFDADKTYSVIVASGG